MSDDLEKGRELMQSLVGRTITAASWIDSNPKEDWGHHEEATITLDDGRVILFSSYGYDADGAEVSDISGGDRWAKYAREQHGA